MGVVEKIVSAYKLEDPGSTRDDQVDVQMGEVVTRGLHRNLTNRQIQLIAIGGSIGTALFISIAWGLIEGGPGSLLTSWIVYCCFLACVNSSLAEMTCYMPVAGSFVSMATKWVDEAFGFAVGWNFYVYIAFLIPFEISALILVLQYWSDNIPAAAICIGCIVLYAIINVFTVGWYGETEFWLSGGKVILIFLVFGFTFVTMVGGNPQHDAYGFRYWNNPGAFNTYVTTGALGRFEGWLAALYEGAFTIVGPEYIGMVAGEAKNLIKQAFKTVYLRFGIFFIGGALCVGIVVPYNDPRLNSLLSSGSSSTAAASPYVVAMSNMKIRVLPDFTNALLATSIFSAGNTYVYVASRILFSMAQGGHAPRFFRRVTKNGIPVYCFALTIMFAFLSFLSVGSSASQGLTWLSNLTEASQIINYICMCIVYLCFYRAVKAQGIDRRSLPYYGYGQPYVAIFGMVMMILTVSTYGYTTFLPGWWNTGTFFTFYLMVFVVPVLYVFWKFYKRTKAIKPQEADLVWEIPIIEQHEAAFIGQEEKSLWQDFVSLFRRRPSRGSGPVTEEAGFNTKQP